MEKVAFKASVLADKAVGPGWFFVSFLLLFAFDNRGEQTQLN